MYITIEKLSRLKRYRIDPIDHDVKWSLLKDIGKNKKIQ